jgi:hypothetical protein
MLWGIQNSLRFFFRALLGQQVPQHNVYAPRFLTEKKSTKRNQWAGKRTGRGRSIFKKMKLDQVGPFLKTRLFRDSFRVFKAFSFPSFFRIF